MAENNGTFRCFWKKFCSLKKKKTVVQKNGNWTLIWSCKNYSHKPFFVVQSFSYFWLFATPWTAACQNLLSFIISQSLLKVMSIELVIPSNHLVLCCSLLLLSSIFSSIRVFSNESGLRIRWPSIGAPASASVLPMNIPMNWLLWSPWGPRDSQASFPAPQLEASILLHSAFFMVQLAHPYMCCAVLSHSVMSDSLWPHGP